MFPLKFKLYLVEGVSLGELVGRERVVAEAEHALAQSAELHVGVVEAVLPVLGQLELLAVDL